jgi:hypothetical protein
MMHVVLELGIHMFQQRQLRLVMSGCFEPWTALTGMPSCTTAYMVTDQRQSIGVILCLLHLPY